MMHVVGFLQAYFGTVQLLKLSGAKCVKKYGMKVIGRSAAKPLRRAGSPGGPAGAMASPNT
jgi:hypothetical protein